MNQDFDRRSLDHRINDIEKIKFSNNTFPSIDFDAYEDNSIQRTKDGVVFKCFYDFPSFQLNICGICSTRYGIISGQNLAMARLVVKNSHVAPHRESHVISIKRYGYLGEDCSNYSQFFDTSIGLEPWFSTSLNLFTFDATLPHAISSNRVEMIHNFDNGNGACISIQTYGGTQTINQGVYFLRRIGCNLIGNQKQNLPMYLSEYGRSNGFERYNTVADLPNKYKPLFPASWSV